MSSFSAHTILHEVLHDVEGAFDHTVLTTTTTYSEAIVSRGSKRFKIMIEIAPEAGTARVDIVREEDDQTTDGVALGRDSGHQHIGEGESGSSGIFVGRRV